MVEALGIDPIRGYIESLIYYEYSRDLDHALGSVTSAMNIELSDEIFLSSSLTEAIIQDVILLPKQLLINVKLSGKAQIEVNLLGD